MTYEDQRDMILARALPSTARATPIPSKARMILTILGIVSALGSCIVAGAIIALYGCALIYLAFNMH